MDAAQQLVCGTTDVGSAVLQTSGSLTHPHVKHVGERGLRLRGWLVDLNTREVHELPAGHSGPVAINCYINPERY